jgi:hypothetical protein
MLSNSARRDVRLSFPGPDLVVKDIFSFNADFTKQLVNDEAGTTEREKRGHTNFACIPSISVFILSCSASYAALSGFPNTLVAGTSSDVSGVAEVGTGVEVPVLAGVDLDPFALEVAPLVGAAFDLGEGIVESYKDRASSV